MSIPPELAAQMESLDRDINAVAEIGYEDITDALLTVRETLKLVINKLYLEDWRTG